MSHPQSVTNSAFHEGEGAGLLVDSSKDVTFTNNIIFDMVAVGANIMESQAVTISNNFVGNIKPGEPGKAQGGIVLCAEE